MTRALTVKNAGKDYKSSGKTIKALSGVDLSVEKNEFVCVVGPNGCGKSTLLKIAGGILEHSSGDVNVIKKTAYLPQSPSLLPWRTIEDNMMLPAEIRKTGTKTARNKARKMLQEFDLSEFAETYPRALSGGMQQKAVLIRSVLTNPRLLLLDEPFSALDAITRVNMQSWLLDLWQKSRPAVVCVTHDIREAIFLSDTIYVMSGRPGTIKERLEVDLPRPRKHRHLHLEKAKKLEKRLNVLLGVKG